METPGHTVAETAPFIASADKAGMTASEREAAIQQIAASPEAGDMIVGSGGVRKVRVAGRGHGKSGGFRIATLFIGPARPVYLLWVLSKGKAANFTADQIAAMKGAVERIKKGP